MSKNRQFSIKWKCKECKFVNIWAYCYDDFADIANFNSLQCDECGQEWEEFEPIRGELRMEVIR